MTDKPSPSLWVKLQTIFSGCILALLLLLVIGGVLAYGAVGHSLELIENEVEQLKMDEVNEAIAALTEAANQLAAVDVDTLNQTATSLREAADTLAALDIDEINNTVLALTEAANNLSELDVNDLNGLINSLNNVAERLNGVTGAISRFFGGS